MVTREQILEQLGRCLRAPDSPDHAVFRAEATKLQRMLDEYLKQRKVL